ncbi:SpvB/TcaC N-terminal domain-containing protein [Microbacterium sp. NPDC064584]|uniref:SpvB/TcaC N-terminal domain-containing protein n=1 Tax=Microbacterium sp. NPDC064584 TaxID=3155817 RepID=UPI003424795B
MGEKFSSNPVNGTGSMSVPLSTSPGRSGFGPDLSLSYDSASGNGPFGFGWTLSLASVTRKTDDGVPRYLDEIDSDDFVLSGADDLVPLLVEDPPGTWHAPPATSRVVDGRTYSVALYRPRIEGAFARVEQWTNLADLADVVWRTISRDNVTSWYGRSARSRIADPADPRRIFSWLLCETHDDKGNVVVYDYRPEDSERIFEDAAGGHLAKAHEQNRDAASRSAQRYPDRVRYGNRAPYYPRLDPAAPWPEPADAHAEDGSSSWLFELVFDYGDRDETTPTPAPVRAWPCRPDPFSAGRSGFDVRTYRTCRRTLMFHHFPDEAGVGRNCLVASTDLTYSSDLDPLSARNPVYTFLVAVTQTGYRRSAAGYDFRSRPAVELRYSEPRLDDTVHEVERGSVDEVPLALADERHRWIDLHGDGVPGILTEQSGAWFYERNLSPISKRPDGTSAARFAAAEPVGAKPTAALQQGADFFDLGGDGSLDIVAFDGSAPGFFQHDGIDGWLPFVPLNAPPVVDLSDPNLRFVDLDGDGRLDLLITEDDALIWYQSLGESGFEPGRRIPHTIDERDAPRVVFRHAGESINLADVTGDGLSDILRIRNGDVSYWQNFGHGRFGPKVTMDHAPWFDAPDQFDPRRLRLVDVDGSGTTDILYLHSTGVLIFFNQSGNGWSAPQPLAITPLTDDVDRMICADLLGNGTACLVWTSRMPGGTVRPSRYVDLMGAQKPHLLTSTINNMGGETHVTYTSSTKFALQDRLSGRPWLTRLPFPVHVVEQVETIDRVARTRFVSRYAYHHGCFDSHEREFRGFGMVEQLDTAAFEDHVLGVAGIDGLQETAPEFFQPPVTTRTWYHTGAFADAARLTHGYRDEYYLAEQHLPPPHLPEGLETSEWRESVRALRGAMIRQEVYSHDGSAVQEHPYAVTEGAFEVRRLQPRGKSRHAVFLPIRRENVLLSYERDPLDPRISHTLELDLDEYGNPRRTCDVVYGRRLADPGLPVEVTRAQQELYVACGEFSYTEDLEDADALRGRVPYAWRKSEITGIRPAGGLFSFGELALLVGQAVPIDYEVVADGASPQRRLLADERTTFLDNGLDPMPLGEWDTLGLAHQSYSLRLTPGTLAVQYAGAVTDADLSAAGYLQLFGEPGWWSPSATSIYPPAPADEFFLPVGTTDPLGLATVATFDAYRLLTESVRVVQAAWTATTVVNDYRVLAPVLLTDVNGNRSAVQHDELGMVVVTAIMGKIGASDGDDLADPTSRLEYELFNWQLHGKPNYVRTLTREQHGVTTSPWQEMYAYSTGGGEVGLVKALVHPGRALRVNADSSATEVDADPRWLGSGRVIVDNKGNVVKQYEPYFSVTNEFEDDKSVSEIGVTAIAHFDPLGRVIRTDMPDGTLTRVEFSPWFTRSFDANDTVADSDWYALRGSPDPTVEPEPQDDPDRRAAWLAARHSGTPAVTHLDSLERAVYAVADYGGGKTAAIKTESDLTGRFSRIIDQKQREVASGFAAIGGSPVISESAERGRRWTFVDVLGRLVRTWDEHGRRLRLEYDELHRPISSFVGEGGTPDILHAHIIFGDRLGATQARQLNLLGVAHVVFDQSGYFRIPGIDFRGRPTSVERVLTAMDVDTPDWSSVSAQTNVAAALAAAAPLLDPSEIFTSAADYDALDRPTRVTLADGTEMLPVYNRAGFLASMSARIRGEGPTIDFLKAQDCDAKGQRTYAHHGNDVVARFAHDPETFRLTDLVSAPVGDDAETEALQRLRYSYDPVGNITQIRDDAQQTRFFNNAVVVPETRYEYDAIYQLTKATGRELAGVVNDAIRTNTDLDAVTLKHPNDLTSVRTYTEEYEYDLLGNITRLAHRFRSELGAGSGWTRRFRYARDEAPTDRTNRLTSTSRAGDPEAGPFSDAYAHDVYGNMARMPHLASMQWNASDQLHSVDLGGGGRARYDYAFSGQRIRKVIERAGNLNLEWIYLGAVQLFRRRRRETGELRFERSTVHIGDGTDRIAQVDTKIRDDDNTDPSNPLGVPLIRYQYTNHLGSAVLETDATGEPISYEEYHPYGTTAYRSAKPGVDLSLRRFRFSGKELDDETGLLYFGARYYAPWLGRWISPDPAGFADALNLFRYCANSPIMNRDPTGMQEQISYLLDEVGLTGVSDPAIVSSKLRAGGFDFTGFDSAGQELPPDNENRGVGLVKPLEGGGWDVGHWLKRPASGESGGTGTGPTSDTPKKDEVEEVTVKGEKKSAPPAVHSDGVEQAPVPGAVRSVVQELARPSSTTGGRPTGTLHLWSGVSGKADAKASIARTGSGWMMGDIDGAPTPEHAAGEAEFARARANAPGGKLTQAEFERIWGPRSASVVSRGALAGHPVEAHGAPAPTSIQARYEWPARAWGGGIGGGLFIGTGMFTAITGGQDPNPWVAIPLVLGGVAEATSGIMYGSGAILGSAEAMAIGAAGGTLFAGATAAIGFGVASARSFERGDNVGGVVNGLGALGGVLLVASLFTPVGWVGLLGVGLVGLAAGFNIGRWLQSP